MQAQRADRLALIRAIEAERRSRVLSYVMAEGTIIADDAVLPIYYRLAAMGRCPRLDLYIVSRGGITEVCWKLVTLLREFTDHLGIIVPYRAHSGGTLIALGADEIVMGPMSELGATDPARSHFLLPSGGDGQPAPVSVEDLRRCIEFIRREGGGHTDFVTALFSYIHPLAIGALEQSHALVERIARKALATHWDAEARAEDIERVVVTLNGRLHSHTYPIGRAEARDDLGLPVVDAAPSLWARVWALYEQYQAGFGMVLPGSSPDIRRRCVCIVETTDGATSAYQMLRAANGVEQVVGGAWETI
ncbi:MAG: hypothetical protein U0822_12865 [Anaerolineae bacterium]